MSDPRRRLISNATLWHLHTAEGRKDALVQWVRDNGLDPDLIPIDEDLIVETGDDGARTIRFTEWGHNEDGVKTASESGEDPRTERVVPLLAEPPEDWPVYAVPGPA